MTKHQGPVARPAKRKGGRRRTDGADRAAVVSHEVRGPLGAVATLVDVLLSTGLDPEQRRLVELVQLANAHVLGVAEDLVADASLAADRFRVIPADFSPADPVHAVAALWRPLVERAGPALSVTVGDDLPATVLSDARRVRQILFNLVSNATKAPGVANVEVAVRAGAEPGTVSFTVTDDGAGLPSGFTPEPFAADMHEGEAAGAGLGLWISGRVAEALSGRLFFVTRPDGGTVARLDLPVAVGERPIQSGRPRRGADAGSRRPARAAATAGGARRSAGEDRWPRRSALVVDDSVVSRMLMTTVLSSFGLQVVTAATGEEAEREAASRRPDVILLDWSLHRETGAEVMARLRGLFGADLPPVLAVSAAAAPILGAGIRAHVVKPFTPREMFAALEGVLEGAERRETVG